MHKVFRAIVNDIQRIFNIFISFLFIKTEHFLFTPTVELNRATDLYILSFKPQEDCSLVNLAIIGCFSIEKDVMYFHILLQSTGKVQNRRLLTPTSIIKHPPQIKGAFRLFLLKLSTGLQQPLIHLGNLRRWRAAHRH